MKYIKQFEGREGRNAQYRVGDFVLTNKIMTAKEKLPDYLIAEIIDRISSEYYFVGYYNNFVSRIGDYDIIRKATSEEIEEYKMRKDSLKYNV